jgi:tetratricopeptide (TPR) repeat protein
MKSLRLFIITVVATLLPASYAIACLWDYDTISMERSRFPTTLELITGKFLRHSREFYLWRIENRLKRLKTDSNNLALLDDLAVAYDKTGQHELAIATAIKADSIQPNRYETAANLGTFYFHSGNFDEGLKHIDRALEINPDAHFGRELYQRKLVEYLQEQRRETPDKLPLANLDDGDNPKIGDTFGDYISDEPDKGLSPKKLEAAVKGVLGMMKFGHYDSPILLEALGSILTQKSDFRLYDAKQLAARAYLKAAYKSKDDRASAKYRAMAKSALKMQVGGAGGLDQVEKDFRQELEEANKWSVELREKELRWIREANDPDAEFAKLYSNEPQVTDFFGYRMRWRQLGIAAQFAGFVIVMTICFRWWRGRNRQTKLTK